MKKYINISAIFLCFFIISCDHSENEELPGFLDGTEYGILLHVDVTSATTFGIADVNSANVSFEVSYEGNERPVESITVNKTYVGAGGTSSEIEQTRITEFPSNVSLSASDLVNGVPDLMVETLQAGDKFQIKFQINYSDGITVTRFGTLLNPNFDVTFE